MMKTLCLVFLTVAVAFSEYKVVDSIPKGTSVHWQTGDTILLNGTIYVDSSVLKIDSGVVVKAKQAKNAYDPENDERVFTLCPALVITKTGYIDAKGTKDKPIIFTSELDDLTKKNDVTFPSVDTFWGFWGGIVILGDAKISKAGGTDKFRAVSENDTRASFGGSDDSDSSGVLRYVSIRYAATKGHAGFAGLSLCGVGTKTVIENIDVYKSFNDGVKIYGGAVNLKYIASHYPRFDGFQIDEGYHGFGQFWNAIMFTDFGMTGTSRYAIRIGASTENGGIALRTDTVPYTAPFIANATLISTDGYLSSTSGSIQITNNSIGYVYNSIIRQLAGLDIELPSMFTGGEASWKRKTEGRTAIEGNVFWDFVNASDPILWTDFTSNDSVSKYFKNVNIKGDPKFPISDAAVLDLRPDSSLCFWYGFGQNPARKDSVPPGAWVVDLSKKTDNQFITANIWYTGAFDPIKPMWIRKWTGSDFDSLLSTFDSALVDTTPPVASMRKYEKQTISQLRLSESHLKIDFQISESQNSVLKIFNLMGVCVVTKNLGMLNSGNNSISLNKNILSSGYYVARISSGNGSVLFSNKFIMP